MGRFVPLPGAVFFWGRTSTPEEEVKEEEDEEQEELLPHAYEQKKGQYDQQREQNQVWFPTKRNKMRVPNANSRGHAKKRGL